MPDLYELALGLVIERYDAGIMGARWGIFELMRSLKKTCEAAMAYAQAEREARHKHQKDEEAWRATRTQIEAEEHAEAEMHENADELEDMMTRVDEEIARY